MEEEELVKNFEAGFEYSKEKIAEKVMMERTFRVEPLVDVTEIPTDNEGIKCGSGNKEFLKVDLKANKQEDCWTNKDGDGCCFENHP